MDSFLLIFNSLQTVLSFIFSIWWLLLPFFLYLLAYIALKNYTNLKYRMSLEWVLLQIKAPKEIHKSPKAMEQIFAGLHGIYIGSVRWHRALFKGEIPDWFSFEIMGRGGETSFYIRTLSKYKNLVEAQVYAQYPEAEVVEVPDYVNDAPLYLPDDTYDIWGADLLLNKPDAFPIRTYPEFEEKPGGPDEAKRIDPLASLSELFAMLHTGEQIWIQILTNPAGDEWIKRGQQEIDKIMGKTPAAPKSNFLTEAVFAIDKAISGAAPGPAGVEKKEEKKERVDLTPGKQEALKAVERSFDKLGFETGIRFIYMGPKNDFHQAHVAGIMGAFKQYSSQNLNGFKINPMTMTFAKGLFKKSKTLTRKRALYQAYRERKMMNRKYVLNTEELATIFHFPDTGVKSPLLPRVDAKKGEPPVGLPTM